VDRYDILVGQKSGSTVGKPLQGGSMCLHHLSGARPHGPSRGSPNNDRAPLSAQLNDRVSVNPDHFQNWAVKNQAHAIADGRQLLK